MVQVIAILMKVLCSADHTAVQDQSPDNMGIKNSEYDQEIPQSQTADKPMPS